MFKIYSFTCAAWLRQTPRFVRLTRVSDVVNRFDHKSFVAFENAG